jgi:hypothetical protein
MKRPSLFAMPSPQPAPESAAPTETIETPIVRLAPPPTPATPSQRPKSRQGKRIASVYLDPEALRQLQKIAFDEETSLQALLSEGVNAVFEARGKTRMA